MKKLLLVLVFLSLLSCSTEDDKPTPQYILTVTSGEGGTVSTEGGTYDEGTDITIIATADEFYTFSGWEGNDSNEKSITIQI
jgi:hypothetical protein